MATIKPLNEDNFLYIEKFINTQDFMNNRNNFFKNQNDDGISFVKIERTGNYTYAVFVDNNMRRIAFNESSLRERIENSKKYGCNTSQEEIALAAFKDFKK